MTTRAIAEKLIIVLSAPGTDATTGLDVLEIKFDEAFSITEITIQCDEDNPPTGSAAQIDVNKNGTTVFSTVATIDASESHSDTAATAPVLSASPTSIADGDVLSFDIDQIGSTNAGQGYKATIHLLRPIVG